MLCLTPPQDRHPNEKYYWFGCGIFQYVIGIYLFVSGDSENKDINVTVSTDYYTKLILLIMILVIHLILLLYSFIQKSYIFSLQFCRP